MTNALPNTDSVHLVHGRDREYLRSPLATPAADDGMQSALAAFAADLEEIVPALLRPQPPAPPAAAGGPLPRLGAALARLFVGAPAPAPDAPPAHSPGSPFPTIVIVYHDPRTLMLLYQLVISVARTCRVVATMNGADALAQVSSGEVALLITGEATRTASGLQLTTAVRQSSPQTKVLLFAGG